MNLEKVYQPKLTEEKIYQLWLKTGFFNPDKLPGQRKKKFSIVLPPPNITGSLHMGHALCFTIQDILIRWKRLQGFKALWVPGTDHAGIATQYVVEKELKKEGKTRFDLGREKFLERVWQWVEKYGEIILEQLKKVGYSLDWSRKKFTMEKDYCQAVEQAFFHYYKKGWIYKGKRLINWCKRCKSSLSDLEVEYKKEKGNLWYIKYPIKNQKVKGKSENYVVVATTRPETMLGDTAVAVNPKDKRYKNLVGKTAILPFVEREIPIVADQRVEKEFGTGAVKVTPAHDFLDYEISLKHNLPQIQVIDEEGKMFNVPKEFEGLEVLEARKKLVEKLEKEGFLVKVEPYEISLPTCYRCGGILEILPSEQWFLKMEKLARMATEAVKSGKVKFVPKRFEKIYLDWLSSTRDWCISRQIWWGHKIPVEGEEAVLDTWFSSALWPFAVFGWPKKTKDLEKFYPTDVLVTGRDIINLWVARMVFSGLEFTKKAPFKYVFINPTVLTKEGKRMSKSLGTGIDPIYLIEEYGADATRFGLVWQVKTGQDLRFDKATIQMGEKFCNKIWNASRFVLLQIKDEKSLFDLKPKFSPLTKEDKKMLADFKKTVKTVTKNLENFEFGKAAENLYHFFWHKFCDVYIEKAKERLKAPETKKQTLESLLFFLLKSLILLHPFIPFITEEIYQKLPVKNKKPSIMVEDWPS
jgi:valyl-tRNA synthetase